jgi:DinB superfamily
MNAMMRSAVVRQFGAALKMLHEAVERCPDELWDDRSEGTPFWQIAYHALFFLDLYLSQTLEGFKPAEFHVENANVFVGEYPWMKPAGKIGLPEFEFSKAQVLGYMQQCWAKCKKRVEGMTEESAAQKCAFPWYGVSVGEMTLINLRHVQHHVGQLAAVLRRRAGIGLEWKGSEEEI